MLDDVRLRDRLQRFCNPGYSGFTGFPATRSAARQAWADAFGDYFDQVEEHVPGAPAGHPSLTTTAVVGDFHDDLDLDLTLSAADAAADFAGAWRAATLGVTFGTVTDGSGNVWTPVVVPGSVPPTAFTNVDPNHVALLATLTTLFSTPASDALARLGDIADAFHLASRTLIVNVGVVNSGGSPLPTTSMALQ